MRDGAAVCVSDSQVTEFINLSARFSRAAEPRRRRLKMEEARFLRIFAAFEVEVGELSPYKQKTVACIVAELAAKSMRLMVAAGCELPFAKKLIPQVARHIASQATSCETSSISSALEPKRLLRWHASVAGLRLILTPNDSPIEELAADVLEIIAGMEDSPTDCFSATLLQPLAEAMLRINSAFQSMPPGKSKVLFPAVDDEENARENAAENAPLEPEGTPPRKKQRQDACEAEGGWTPAAVLHDLQASVHKLTAAMSRQHEVEDRRYEVEDGRHGDVVEAIQSNTVLQAKGFYQLQNGQSALATLARTNMQNMAALAESTVIEQQAALAHREAAQLHREQSARGRELLSGIATTMAPSFSALLEMVTKCASPFTYLLTHDTKPYITSLLRVLTTRPGGGSGAREPGGAWHEPGGA